MLSTMRKSLIYVNESLRGRNNKHLYSSKECYVYFLQRCYPIHILIKSCLKLAYIL